MLRALFFLLSILWDSRALADLLHSELQLALVGTLLLLIVGGAQVIRRFAGPRQRHFPITRGEAW